MAPPRVSPPEADANRDRELYGAWANLRRTVNKQLPGRLTNVRTLARSARSRLR